jgi:glycosyltransferase involved in cell wall biosynthesis
MRILMLAQFYAPVIGGEERMTESLALALSARGHEVSVATLRQEGQPRGEVRDGIAVHRLGGLSQRLPFLYSEGERRHAPPLPDPETVLELRALLTSERPDVVHAHNWLGLAYLPLQRGRPAAYVLSMHDFSLVCANKRLVRRGGPCGGPGPLRCAACAATQYGPLTGPPIALATALSSRAQTRAVDLFLPVSRAVAASCGLERARVAYEIVPNFLSEHAPVADPGDPRLSRLPAGEMIVFVGDVTADKGAGDLIEAHARAHTGMPLVLIGRIADPNLMTGSDDVIALGPLAHDAVLAAWRRATIAVVPSVQPEAFGVVALEAMAAGAPVVAAAHGGLADVVVDGDSGILFPPRDVGALAGALSDLAADAALRERLGTGARARAAEFSEAAVAPRVESAYERARELRARRRRR